MTGAVPGQVVIGLDVGTTGVKAVAFGLGSSWRRMALREYRLLQPGPDQEVQDPAAIIAATGAALAECVAAAGSAQVLAISVSTGMHGLMALDDRGRPLTPLLTWADGRAREEARWLRGSGHARTLHALTGTPVHPMSPLTKLMWFTRHAPDICAAARWWVGLKEYVLHWLTGELVTELSSASGTGLMDMSTRAWSADATAVCGVPIDRLPPILATTATLPLNPATAAQVGLPAGVPVVVGAADGPLGNLGTGAVEPGVAGLSLGTSGAVRTVVQQPRIDEDGTLFCYALTDSAWFIGGAISNGGVVARWAGATLAPDVRAAAGDEGADAAVLDLAARVPAGSDGLVMLPYLLAERAPLWDPDLPGVYLGLRREHTRAHMIRAAVEGVCMQMRIILDRLDEIQPVSSVRATGGVFRSALWREVMAGMLARPVYVVGGADGTALGAAVLGLVGIGGASTLAEAASRFTDPGAAPAPAVPADPALVAAYDLLCSSVPALIGSLDSVAGLFARKVPRG
jgi:gluconokinase